MILLAAIPMVAAAQDWHYGDVDAQIRAFALSRNADDLQRALDSLKEPFWVGPGTTNSQGGTMHSLRKAPADAEIVRPWLEFYAAVDAADAVMRRDFKMPVTHVYPPPQAGVSAPGGVDPMEIKDPELRKQYEEKIAENERRRLASINMARVEHIRMDASSFFWLWANGLYYGDTAAGEKTSKQARELGCSDERAAWLYAVLENRRGTFAPVEPKPAILPN